jgi:hypothetical protein
LAIAEVAGASKPRSGRRSRGFGVNETAAPCIKSQQPVYVGMRGSHRAAAMVDRPAVRLADPLTDQVPDLGISKEEQAPLRSHASLFRVEPADQEVVVPEGRLASGTRRPRPSSPG